MFKNSKGLIFIAFFMVANFFSDAQHSMLLLNGNEHAVKSYDVKGDYLIYSKPGEKPGKRHKMFLDRLYSINDSLLGERIVYMPDSTDTLELNKTDMRTFIYGEQYAMKHYKKPMNAVAGAAVGIGSGFLNIYGLFVPFVYVGVANRFSAKVPTNLPDAPAMVGNDLFKEGYQYKARKKKAKDGLIFGGIGFALSFTLITILAK